ncbi:Inorganic diphosphatase [Bertholletia excelsa]
MFSSFEPLGEAWQGFAIGSAALVFLAFCCIYDPCSNSNCLSFHPKVFTSSVVGAMLLCWFSDMTMKSE